ncbi:MAG: diaminopimelate epimerase [Elusimicrobia bacterium]|nr:diaminopimelate epimerase [Elusimicrobiota bacterium]
MKINFWKLSGAGNDFILIPGRSYNSRHLWRQRRCSGLSFSTQALRRLARILCERKLSIGADGLLWVKKSASNAVTVKYFNSDGSEAFCGNGSRCAAWWAYASGLVKTKEFFLETAGGRLSVEIAGFEKVRMKMPDINRISLDCKTGLSGCAKKAHFLNTGVPHIVVPVKNFNSIDVDSFGRRLRHSRIFGKEGTNVNFVKIINNELHVRTYERGVEAETLACGTGITASAIVYGITGNIKSPISCIPKSREVFKVWFKKLKDGKVKDVYIQGPAKMVFEGKIDIGKG